MWMLLFSNTFSRMTTFSFFRAGLSIRLLAMTMNFELSSAFVIIFKSFTPASRAASVLLAYQMQNKHDPMLQVGVHTVCKFLFFQIGGRDQSYPETGSFIRNQACHWRVDYVLLCPKHVPLLVGIFDS